MLTYILAVLVGTGSVGLYVAAFFFPEIHRKNDFIWSGVGLFYALSLWIYARQTTGGILVGQTASVALLGWFVWQTLQLRRQLVPIDRQTPIPTTAEIKQQLGIKQSAKPASKPPARAKSTAPVPPAPPANPAPVATPSARVKSTVPVPPAPPANPAPVETAPAQVAAPVRSIPQPPIAPLPAADSESEEAWIKLEVKPSKPVQQIVRPPIVPQLPAIAAESVPRKPEPESIEKVPSEPTETSG